MYLITGTPGVGKSTMAKLLAERTKITWRDVSKLAIENECIEEFDEVYKCPILDEDKVIKFNSILIYKKRKIFCLLSECFFLFLKSCWTAWKTT